MPDVVLCRPPRVIFSELKRERGKLTHARLHHGRRTRWTEGQAEWIRDLLACPGVETYWWVPSDAGDIVTILQTGAEAGMPCLARTRSVLQPEGGPSNEQPTEGGAPPGPDGRP